VQGIPQISHLASARTRAFAPAQVNQASAEAERKWQWLAAGPALADPPHFDDDAARQPA
jgi:hypothetical protein